MTESSAIAILLVILLIWYMETQVTSVESIPENSSLAAHVVVMSLIQSGRIDLSKVRLIEPEKNIN